MEGDELAAGIVRDHPRAFRVGLSESADLVCETRSDSPDGQQLTVQGHRGHLCLPGEHNTKNALLALAAAQSLDVPLPDAVAALGGFRSVGRRFERREAGGVTVIADYAHHPTEIRALLRAVKALGGRRILAAFQPHRFSRTRHLLDEFAQSFAGVDRLYLLPVYAASESVEQAVDTDALAPSSRQVCPTVTVSDFDELVTTVAREIHAGDIFLIVGAGDIIRVHGMICDVLNQDPASHA